MATQECRTLFNTLDRSAGLLNFSNGTLDRLELGREVAVPMELERCIQNLVRIDVSESERNENLHIGKGK